MGTKYSRGEPQRQRGFIHLPMLQAVEEFEDLISEHKEADWKTVSKREGISPDDPQYNKLGQIFQSMKNRNVTSACLTIHRSISDSKEEEPVTQSVIANPDWLYIKEDEDQMDLKALTGKAKEFRDEVQDKLTHELLDDQLNPKSADDLSTEAATEDCNGNAFNLIREHCPCFKRIHIVMETYHNLLHDEERSLLWQEVTIPDLIQSNQYGHQQLMDDFMHIQLSHIDKSNNSVQNEETKESEQQMVGQQMALYFMQTFQCGDGPQDMGKCKGNSRHFRTRQESRDMTRVRAYQALSEKERERERNELQRRERERLIDAFRSVNSHDIAFQEECDKIHSFFLQFGVHSVCLYIDCNVYSVSQSVLWIDSIGILYLYIVRPFIWALLKTRLFNLM